MPDQDISDIDLDDLGDRVVERLYERGPVIGEHVILTRRQAVAIAASSAGVGLLASLGVDTASAASADGQVGTPSKLVDVYGAEVTGHTWLEPPVVATTGSSYEIDCAAGAVFILTLDADVSFSFTNVDSNDANSVYLKLIQDSTGGRSPSWPSNVQWPGGSEPSWSDGAGDEDVVTLVHDPDNDVWDGFAGGLGMA